MSDSDSSDDSDYVLSDHSSDSEDDVLQEKEETPSIPFSRKRKVDELWKVMTDDDKKFTDNKLQNGYVSKPPITRRRRREEDEAESLHRKQRRLAKVSSFKSELTLDILRVYHRGRERAKQAVVVDHTMTPTGI